MNQAAAQKKQLKKHLLRCLLSLALTIGLVAALLSVSAYAAAPGGISINLGTSNNTDTALGAIEVLFLLMLLALGPSILMLMTSFTRVIIVLSFLRNALGTQQSPPNQVLVGLALFLTLFIMQPVISEINTTAYKPYTAGEITQEEFIQTAMVPMKSFMLRQTQKKDLSLFLNISGRPAPEGLAEGTPEQFLQLGLDIVVPAFITSELRRAFTMGFLLFIPFLIIDIVVSSTLMSMGMVMLPPAMIALPFKILMFVLVDGWSMLLGTLAQSFH